MSTIDSIPVEDLIRLIEQLRAAAPSPHPPSSELSRYLAGVAQGREQAARRIEELLVEYEIAIIRQEETP